MALPLLARLGAVAGRMGGDEGNAGTGIDAKVDTKTFNADLNKFAAKLDADVRDVIRLLALKIESGAVVRTPVDTGRARASWNTSEEVHDTSVMPEGEYGAFKGNLSAHPNPTGYLSGEKPIHITNNLEYILDLEYGSSSQAPNGMARLAVADALAELQSIVDEI